MTVRAMRYHYSHTRTMRRHGVQICPECEGDGYRMTGAHYWSQRQHECPSCHGKGAHYDDAHGLAWKRVRNTTMRTAA